MVSGIRIRFAIIQSDWQGRSWHVGDAFAGQGVVFEPREDAKVVGVRFANLVLGEIGGESDYCSIRPTEFTKRRGGRRIETKKPTTPPNAEAAQAAQ